MALTAGGIFYPDGAAEFNPAADMQTQAESVDPMVIHEVANTTERDALAAAFGPSATRPLYVHRGDAPTGGSLEVTTDGTTWRTIWTSQSPSTATALTPSSGWTKYPDPYDVPYVYRDGPTVFLTAGALARTGTTLAVTAGVIFTVATGIPLELRPAKGYMKAGEIHYSSPPTIASVRVTTGGDILVVAGTSGTVPLDASGYVGIPDFNWPLTGA
jgi:hypothetical protein